MLTSHVNVRVPLRDILTAARAVGHWAGRETLVEARIDQSLVGQVSCRGGQNGSRLSFHVLVCP